MSQNGRIFQSLVANSLLYLTKIIGQWGRFGAFAADSFFHQTGSQYRVVFDLSVAISRLR